MKFTCEMSLYEAAQTRPAFDAFGISERGWEIIESYMDFGGAVDASEIDNWGINEFSERTLAEFIREYSISWDDVPESEYTPEKTLLNGLYDCGKIAGYYYEGCTCWLIVAERATTARLAEAMNEYAL